MLDVAALRFLARIFYLDEVPVNDFQHLDLLSALSPFYLYANFTCFYCCHGITLKNRRSNLRWANLLNLGQNGRVGDQMRMLSPYTGGHG